MSGTPAEEPPPGVPARLMDLLDGAGARYRVIRHAPEGRTDVVSTLRGNPVEQAAKCLVVRVKVTKRTSRFVNAVVPGDRRVSLDLVRTLTGARHVLFADEAAAERVTGSVSGAIVPFSFDRELELVVDPALLRHEELFFNAGSLDTSLALAVEDYVRVAAPRVETISESSQAAPAR
jgi:Ala-tRNA(Pro) deacylase